MTLPKSCLTRFVQSAWDAIMAPSNFTSSNVGYCRHWPLQLSKLPYRRCRAGRKVQQHRQRKVFPISVANSRVYNKILHFQVQESERSHVQIHHKSPILDPLNLVPIVCTCEPEQQQPTTQFNSKLALWNCRSIISKASGICDAVLSEKLDILVLTETWLNSDTQDKPVIADITNNLPDHNFILVLRYRDMVVVAELVLCSVKDTT